VADRARREGRGRRQTATIDHPLATSLGGHRNGPLIKELPRRYSAKTGRQPCDDFPTGTRPTARCSRRESRLSRTVGGDVDAVSGERCAFQCYPWRWPEGDACVIRLAAILDPTGGYRLEAGN